MKQQVNKKGYTVFICEVCNSENSQWLCFKSNGEYTMNRCKECENILVPEEYMSELFGEEYMKTYCVSCIKKQVDILIRIRNTVIEP